MPDSDEPSYIGMTEVEATESCKSAGLACRVMERDGKGMFGTMDMRRERVNFAVADGKVVRAWRG